MWSPSAAFVLKFLLRKEGGGEKRKVGEVRIGDGLIYCDEK